MMNRRSFIVRIIPGTGVATLFGTFLEKLNAQSNQTTQNKSGIVTAIGQDRIYLNHTPNGVPITVRITSSTRIWKGEDGMDISVIRPGDEVSMRGVVEADGTFVPTEMWVNIVSLDGIIGSLNGDTVTVLLVRNESATETKQVRLTNNTLSQTTPLKKEDIQAGRPVRVIGLALQDGTILATRFVVYVNGRAVDSRATRYVEPTTGKIVDKP